ncbi:MAG: uncharacterized protein QOE97_2649 [Pseudonocardiales bacterium]|jgi:uncharacterized protein (DUF1684 family)|nr:uncharacterized protein [Pseudonocardiales bacterium]
MTSRALVAEVQLSDWRRRVAELYARVRHEPDPVSAHALWRAERDRLFARHPQTPLLPDDPLRASGLPYWPYDPALRLEAALVPAVEPVRRAVPSASDGEILMRLAGRVGLDALGGELDVWWLEQYGGGLFLPVRDATAGGASYGGGRYLLDTAKGADLGATGDRLVLDLNFLYHPSCRYNPAWECPLAGPGNTTSVALQGGERL